MKVYVCETAYPEQMFDKPATMMAWDVPSIPFIGAINPIYIGVKDQQVARMKKLINQEKLGGSSVGFWEIITKKGKVNWEKLREHDAVFIAGPGRVHPDWKDKYTELVEHIVANA